MQILCYRLFHLQPAFMAALGSGDVDEDEEEDNQLSFLSLYIYSL